MSIKNVLSTAEGKARAAAVALAIALAVGGFGMFAYNSSDFAKANEVGASYTVATEASEGGTIAIAGEAVENGDHSVAIGTETQVTFEPSDGYTLKQVTVSDENGTIEYSTESENEQTLITEAASEAGCSLVIAKTDGSAPAEGDKVSYSAVYEAEEVAVASISVPAANSTVLSKDPTVSVSSSNEHPVFTVIQPGATSSDDGAITSFSITLSDPGEFFDFDTSTIVVSESSQGTLVKDTDYTVATDSSGNLTVALSQTFLNNKMTYTGETFTVVVNGGDYDATTAELLKYADADPDTSNLPVSTSVLTKTVSDNLTTTYASETVSGTVGVGLPVLSATKSVSPSQVGLSEAITYTVTINNSSTSTAAEGLYVEFAPEDGLYALGISPDSTSVSITKGGVTFDLSNATITMTNGVLRVDLGSLTLAASDGDLIVKCTMTVGNDSMSKANFTSLYNLALDGLSTVITAGAENARSTVANTATASLIIPSVTTDASVSSSSLTTGESANVTTTFKVGTTALKKASFTVNADSRLTVSNLKVNGTAYTAGSTLTDTFSSGSTITVTYTVTAPSTYTSSTNGVANTSVTLDALNIINTYTAETSVTIALPHVTQPTVSVSSEKPSAGETVEVTATFSNDGEGTAVNPKLIITDSDDASTNGLITKFSNIKINGTAISSGSYSVSGGTLTINYTGTIGTGATLTVTYEDTIDEGYQANGVSDTISATIEAGTNSNITNSATSASSAKFTVEAPVIEISKTIVSPTVTEESVDENGNLIVNVGDSVFYADTVIQSNTDARGQGFTYTNTLDADLVKYGVVFDENVVITVGAEEVDNNTTTTATEEPIDETIADVTDVTDAVDTIIDDTSEDTTVEPTGTDVTDKYTITFSDDMGTFTVTSIDDSDLPTEEVTIWYTVYAGTADNAGYDQLAGETFTTESVLAVENLEEPVSAALSVSIADAQIAVSKTANSTDVYAGSTGSYTLEVTNEFESDNGSSQVRGLSVTDSLDQSSVNFGYAIDPESIKVFLDDAEITDDADAITITIADGNSGFTLAYNEYLGEDEKLTITYETTTSGISSESLDQSLGNVVLATARNSRPAVDTELITYHGAELPSTAAEGENIAGGDGTSISQTGDIALGVGIAVAIAAASGVVIGVYLFRSRREKM